MELTNYFEGRHNFKDVLLGLNLEEWLQKEGGWGSHTRGALGDMIASEQQVFEREGSVQ